MLGRVLRTERSLSEEPALRRPRGPLRPQDPPTGADPLVSATLAIVTTCDLLGRASEAILPDQPGGAAPRSSGAAGPPTGAAESARALAVQLLSGDVLRVMAEVTVWAAGKVQLIQQVRVAAPEQQRRVPLPMPLDVFLMCCQGLRSVERTLCNLLRYTHVEPRHPQLAPPTGSAVAATHRPRLELLRNLRSSGLLAGLWGAAVAVEIAFSGGNTATGTGRGSVNGERITVKHSIVCAPVTIGALEVIVQLATGSADVPAVRALSHELLSTPEVTRLRFSALEQLAASAPPVAAGGPGTSAGGRAAAGPAGPRQCWALVDPRSQLSLSTGEQTGSLLHPHIAIVDALCAPVDVAQVWSTTPGAGPTADSQLAPLLPPPPRIAALAAASCRAIAAQLGREGWGPAAAGRAAARGGDEGAEAGRSGASGLRGAASAQQDGKTAGRAVGQMGRLAMLKFLYVFWPTDPAQAAGGAMLADMAEACGWTLWGLAAMMATSGPVYDVALIERNVERIVVLFTHLMGGDFPAANYDQQQEGLHRLLRTQPLASLDCLLRHELSQGAQPHSGAPQLTQLLQACACALDLLEPALRADVEEQGRPSEPGADPGPQLGGSTRGSSLPQELLGMFITVAKLAQREAAAAAAAPEGAAGQARAPAVKRLSQVGEHALRETMSFMGACGRNLTELMEEIRGGSGDTTARCQWVRALRTAAVFACRSTLPPMGRLLDGAVPQGVEEEAILEERTNTLAICLPLAALALPSAELLALEPGRLLTRIAQQLQEAAARAAAPCQQQRRGAGRRQQRQQRQEEDSRSGLGVDWARVCHSLHFALVALAAQEGLAETVVSWLQGQPSGAQVEGGGGPSGSPAGSRAGERLDVEALLAAMAKWHPGSAESVRELRRLTGIAARAGTCDAGTGNSELAARLFAHAREYMLLGGLPSHIPLLEGEAPEPWPPRVLRLCCNASCTNFGRPAEAALKLQKCGGCGVVRYCGSDCQRQDWREGGHKAKCAELKRRAEAGASAAEGTQ